MRFGRSLIVIFHVFVMQDASHAFRFKILLNMIIDFINSHIIRKIGYLLFIHEVTTLL